MSYRIILSVLVIFQILNSSSAYYGETEGETIYTPSLGFNSDRNFQYREASYTNCLSFRVKADKDAHIALSREPNRLEWIEIVIGGWGNSKSVIRSNGVDWEQTNVPLNENEYVGFWITWNDEGQIRVGQEHSTEPFMAYNNPNPFDIKYVGVSLTWGSVGSWIIQEPQCPNLPRKPLKFHAKTSGSQSVNNSVSATLISLILAVYKLF